jgi:WD40 repeat protein
MVDERSGPPARTRLGLLDCFPADWGKANTNLYFYGITLAERELAAHRVAPAEEVLATCPPELRRWEWYHFHHRCHADLLTIRDRLSIRADEAGVCSVAYSRDGKRLACGAGNPLRSNTPAQVTIWDPKTGQPILTLSGEHSGPVTAIDFSPDGKRLASASTGLDYLRLAKGDLNGLKAPKGEVLLWDAETGKQLARLPGCSSVAFSPDGKYLAAAGYDSKVLLWDAVTGKPEFTFDGPIGKSAIAFSPDGSRLAAAGEDHAVKVWDAPVAGKE